MGGKGDYEKFKHRAKPGHVVVPHPRKDLPTGTLPDFPGCFSAADEWEQIPEAVQEAVELFFDGEELPIPKPSAIETLLHDDAYQGGVWLMVDIDLSKLSGKTVRINITVPEITLQQIYRAAKKAGVSRSRFMTDAASRMT